MSYPLAALVAGALAERGFDRRYLTAVVAMACGLAVVFAGGVFWLAAFVQARGLGAALAEGFYPFIAADFVKLLLAAAVMPSLWWLARTRCVRLFLRTCVFPFAPTSSPNTSRNRNGGISSLEISSSPAARAALITDCGSTR
jgi:hypothetical protein